MALPPPKFVLLSCYFQPQEIKKYKVAVASDWTVLTPDSVKFI